MYRAGWPLIASAALAVIACGESPSGPSPDTPIPFTVYAQNVYVGANVDAVLAAGPEELPAALMGALGTFAATDWPGRATTIAAAIAARRPDVVALNELTTLDVTGLAPLFPDLSVDFLPILMQALADAGQPYVVAGTVLNIDAQLSLGGPTVRLRDRDALLVRPGLAYHDVSHGTYAARVTVPLGPAGSIELVRGWVAATVTQDGRSVRVVATHLEPRSTSPALQEAQAMELVDRFGDLDLPVLVAGDLNSDPQDPGSTTPYRLLETAGFIDGWLAAPGSHAQGGATCCHQPELTNPTAAFDQRIDLVLVRPLAAVGGGLQVLGAEILGDHPSERGSNGLWASDHAGLVLTFDWRRLSDTPRSPASARRP